MTRSTSLFAVALLVLGAQAEAQQVQRPPKPPTVVKTPPAPTNSKIMSTGGAQGAQKAQGAGSLAPPPPGNAAIKGEAGALKAQKAQGAGSLAPPPPGSVGNAAIKGEAGKLNSPRDPASGGSAQKAAKISSKGFAKQATGGDDGGGDGGLRSGAAIKSQKAASAAGNAAIKGNAGITGNTKIEGNAIKGESGAGGAAAKTLGGAGAVKGVPAVQ